jgi:hypothetical protein
VSSEIEKITELLDYLTADEQAELDALLAVDAPLWVPLPGPQTEAFNSQADELFYGGSAGGGKTDLICGLALTTHRRSAIFRRVGTEVSGIVDRLVEIVGDRSGLNMSPPITWRRPDNRFIEIGACPNAGDERKYQGRPHDLKAFDEITNFTEFQYRFLITWLRTTEQGQRCRVVAAGNPPLDAEGEWVISYWAPWLDPNHPDYPEIPGKLRYYAVIGGKDIERPNGEPFEFEGDIIIPRSRTFIPSSVEDNPFLMSTGYKATLQSLPEPLRSRMLKGDFSAGKEADPWQVIPTEWVKAAQARWTEDGKQGPMDSVGLDVARGGRDKTSISRRHGSWYDRLLVYPGVETPDGATTAGLATAATRNGAPIHVDIIGVGTSPYDHLDGAGVHVVGVNGAEKCEQLDSTGTLRFYNLRAFLWWHMRELLDPASPYPVALPPGQSLMADLCAPRWKLKNGRILVESKDDIILRLQRSPDEGESIIYASIDTPKRVTSAARSRESRSRGSWRSR